jgi:hypothetical protein
LNIEDWRTSVVLIDFGVRFQVSVAGFKGSTFKGSEVRYQQDKSDVKGQQPETRNQMPEPLNL